MDLSINRNMGQIETMRMAGMVAPEAGKTANARSENAGLTITQASASSEDLAVAAIPDKALERDDAIGKLVGAAFNLPAPPVPDFANN